MIDPQYITIRFTPAGLDYMFNCLRARPHAEVDNLIQDIRAQVAEPQTQKSPLEASGPVTGTGVAESIQ